MKTFQNSSLKVKALLIAVITLLVTGCGARKVQDNSVKEVFTAKTEQQSHSSGSTFTNKSDSTNQETVTSDNSRISQTVETVLIADSAVFDPKTGKTTFKGNVKYNKKSTKQTDKDKKTTDTKQQGFNESTNSNFVNDSKLTDTLSSQSEIKNRNVEREGSVFAKGWFWILAGILIIAGIYFTKLWRLS